MPALLPAPDPDGLLEYSVVYSDRALNHMSERFQGVMRDISRLMKKTYGAKSVAIVPGSGTFGMEAVARQFATGKRVMVLRNGQFSYRWTQIFDMGAIPSESIVLKARQQGSGSRAPFAPAPLDEVCAAIREKRPEVVFAPHVETSAGILLPDDYIRAVGAAAREVDALFVLDCVASGCVWVDMRANDVDLIITAPQKGWSGQPCGAMVALGERARARIDGTTSSSFAIDLKKWLNIMEAYENGGHAYHATMPTDTLAAVRDVMLENERYGFERARAEQQELGRRVRDLLEARGYPSVAAAGYRSPGVVVCYTEDPDMQSGKKFVEAGIQAASGVPLECGEPADFRSFRLGLFGLDKLRNPSRTVASLAKALDTLERGNEG
ncbi:MAG: aminotransferase class V-fold PLP-dependent enzyme [Candidatus Accumulibacter sp.]|nr:aminotransferase class V-fold PLP-dependent enzyme [Accumulibacter sp.]